MNERDEGRGLWVAIEGLDGVGKSTVVAGLARALGATLITNPPAALRHQRAVADRGPQAQRRAWYLDVNHQAASDAERRRRSGAVVVMDRSVASTLAFGAAEQGRVASSGGWPRGMARPDLLVFLDLNESARRVRWITREGTKTQEESRLVIDGGFRERVIAGYVALCDHRVDASGAPRDVLAAVMALIPGRRAVRGAARSPEARQ